MLLYPDQRAPEQPENDTVCFAAPIEQSDWMYLKARGKVLSATQQHFVIIEQDENNEVYFMRNESEVTDRVCIILRDNEDPDTCIESAAWVRIQENFPGMIYICRSSPHADKWQAYTSAIGAIESSVCMVDMDLPLENET